jgi:hypothetical protein
MNEKNLFRIFKKAIEEKKKGTPFGAPFLHYENLNERFISSR